VDNSFVAVLGRDAEEAMTSTGESPLDAVPRPGEIRARLAALVREQVLLRALLKVAERKHVEPVQQPRRQEGGATRAS
jgi:hypothetical protein